MKWAYIAPIVAGVALVSLGTAPIGVSLRRLVIRRFSRRDVAQTLVSAAPRLFSALFVHEEAARQECRTQQAEACATSGHRLTSGSSNLTPRTHMPEAGR